ncbi:MAG: dTDP-4-dehydrorhamnose reductase [Candidatus Velthaea sp.]
MNDVVAILGASGQLGTALSQAYAGRSVIAPTHAELDFCDTPALEEFLRRTGTSTLINCTAFHNVDECERTPERAFEVNALAVDRAARACKVAGVTFATISTDYVFDGTTGRAYREDDAPNPLSAYGASKLAGELLVRRHRPEHFIFRTSGVYNASGKTSKGYVFIERVLQQAERGEPVRIVNNMTFAPSFAPHIAAVIRNAIDARAYGTHHVTNAGATTWYDFAAFAFRRAGLTPDLEALAYDNYGSPVKRPMYSALESATLPAAGIAPAPHWETGLDEYLTLRASSLLR